MSIETKKYVLGRNKDFNNLFESFNFNFNIYKNTEDIILDAELIINCTSLGKDGSSEESPVPYELLKKVDENCLIFDVNYINSPSKLLRDADKLGLNYIDGSRMNIMQAVIAFSTANNLIGEEERVLEIMNRAVKS